MADEEKATGNDVQIDAQAEQVLPAGVSVTDVMNNPQLMAAVQAKLNSLMGGNTGFIENLPECVKRRLNALKNIQVECAKLEGKFYEEAHVLEMKYAELFKPLYEKRNQIVNAQYEPNDEEATWVEPLVDDLEKEEDEKTSDETKAEDEKVAEGLGDLKMDDNTKGIPEFWLTAMKNVELLEDMIQEHDEEILKHLIDVRLIFTGKKEQDGSDEDTEMGFVLEFLFSPNDYFTNSALTKTYKMKSEPDADDPFSFEGPDIVACTGCKIDWKKGKNVTQKQVKKKQKHKGRGQTRVITKTVQNDSFFNFFDPPEVPDEEEEDMDEEIEAILAADFEIGHFFRERLIPKAVLFYTGEAIEEDEDDEDDFDDEEGDDEDDDDDDDDDENDPDFKPAQGEKAQECKQQ